MMDNKNGLFKRFAIRFNEFVSDGGVGAALFFIMVELGYINANALHNLDDPAGTWNWVPATMGSLAFSMSTVVVMQRQGHKWLKRILPIFDTALVFLGLNVHSWDVILDYPGHLAQSIFFALFTGFITYSLGMINFEEHVTNQKSRKDEIDDLNRLHSEKLNSLQDKLNASEAEIKTLVNKDIELQSKLKSLESDNMLGGDEVAKLKNELNVVNTKLEEKEKYANILKVEKEGLTGDKSVLIKKVEEFEVKVSDLSSQLKKQESELKEMDKFKRYFYLFEKSRIGKKKDANITELEKKTLEEADEYLKL